MNDLEYSNRQLLPRWIPFSQIEVLNPNINEKRENNNREKENYKELEITWCLIKTVPLAIEIVATSHLLDIADTPLYKEAVDYLLNNHFDKIKNNIYVLELLGKKTTPNISPQKSIHTLRKMSIKNPLNDITWVDMAYFYAIQGQKLHAEKCIEIALSLNPKNTFSIKSIVKFYLLNGDIDKALWILNFNEELKNNPQIISTEISICEAFNQKSRLIRKGISLSKNGIISKYNENELFATIATLEFNSGNSKRGQKLFNQSLLYPNENILAQTRYISSKFNKQIENSNIEVPCSYERDSWVSYINGNFETTIEKTNDWFYFQPFSVTPALMNSYLNSLVFNREEESIKMVENALRINPNDFSLLNNEVVSLYRNNEITKGNEVLKKLEKTLTETVEDSTVLMATQGLSSFRNNKSTEGKIKYETALEIFRKNNNFEKFCRAQYYYACELKRINDISYQNNIIEAYQIATKYSYNDIIFAIKKNFASAIKE